MSQSLPIERYHSYTMQRQPSHHIIDGTTSRKDFVFKAISENTDDGYVVLDNSLNIVGFKMISEGNPSYYIQEPLRTGVLLADYVDPMKRLHLQSVLTRVIGGETIIEDHELNRKGKIFFRQIIFRPVRDDLDASTGVIIIEKDTTDIKTRERQLRIINERYELVAQATSDAIWDYDVTTGQVYFNESFTRSFGHGISGSETHYDVWAKQVHPDDLDRVVKKIREAVNGDQSHWDDEYRFRLKDGSPADVYVRGIIIRDETGKAVRILGSMQNITRQKEHERALVYSEQRFRKLVQSGRDLIWIVDENIFYTYASPSVRQLGYEPSEMIGKYALDLLHPDDLPVAEEILALLKQQGQVVTPPLRVRDASGGWRWVETTATSLIDDPSVKGIVVNSRDITEKKKRAEALQKALNDLNKILDSSVDVIVVTDRNNRFVRVSAAAEKVWGYHPAELVGKTCLDLVHPDDLAKTEQATDQVMKGAELTNFLNRYIRKDGKPVPLFWSASWDAEEQLMYAVARDAREKMEAENKLLVSERRYRELFERNPIPMFMFDLESKQFIMVNDAALQLYGYSEEEFLSKKVTEINPANEVQRFLDFLEQIAKDEDMGFAGEWKHQKKDGTVFDIELHGHNLVREGRHCRLAVIHDVTERNRSRDELRKSEEMFRAISESFPNGIVSILDRDLRYQYVAGQELKNVGLTPEYFVGTLYSQHFADDELNIRRAADEVFRGETIVSEIKFMGRIYLLSSVPLFENDGSIQRILVVAQNITSQKKAQKEKEILINELTRNIRDLRQFSYITSHNLRAPISNLIGIMSLIDMNAISDPDTVFLVEKFKESTYILNETVNDLLNILLIKNNVNVQKERFSLKQVWQDVCTSVNSQIRNGGASIHADFTSGEEIEFNKPYAESILLNLLTNSIKYRHGNRKLLVSLRTEPVEEFLVLHFSDNGIGIDMAQHREKIFGLYQRFHNYPDSKGLGLYIVHSQVTALGGRIEVESEPDKGTCFKIYFKR
ncbi:MAG TPA: PAS domain S-box protein [Chitinophagaceae bacterium]